MKKYLLIAAAVIAVVAGCKHKMTAEEAAADYKAKLEAAQAEISDKIQAIQADTTLTEAQQDSIFDEFYDKFTDDWATYVFGLIKDYPSDSIALQVLKDNYYNLSTDQAEEAVNAIQGDIANDPFVQKIKDATAAMKATAEGQPFTDFTVQTVASVDKDGNPVYQEVKLSDYVGKGKVMLVDFWSPWCPPCKAEIPNIKAVYDKYHSDSFDVLSVAVWEESRGMDWHNTIDTAKVYGINWNQINNAHKEPTDKYGIQGIPHLILFAADGTILKRDIRGEQVEEAVKEAVGE